MLKNCPDKSVGEIEEILYNSLDQFSGGIEQKDDQTYIGIEILEAKKDWSIESLLQNFNTESSKDEYRAIFKYGTQFLS